MRHQTPGPGRRAGGCLTVLLALAMGAADGALDLRNASVERLDNGLTVLLLQDRNFPVASVQMLYRVGARNETAGQTGLAHFLEHMAFRDSENFPDTALVSSIYARGGEWHGYTWTDQTTYFATVPKQDLDLLLRIEADRMARLRISKADMDAERGAVLAELHMYENDPGSLLLDALMFSSFLAHPYRNNTIGWASDIEHLKHAEVVAFYRRYYHPGNAVLAVVGDIDPGQVRGRIEALFGGFPKTSPTPLPHTREPLQSGERRVRLGGHGDERRFVIGYRAPSVNHPDFAPFLVLQAVLGASSGVNFLQNDWGTPVTDGDLLQGAAPDLTTWYPPSAQDYLFVIGGSAAADTGEAQTEAAVEQRVAEARERLIDGATLSAAIDEVLEQLVYDLETTEDAAHQLAFFAGLNALAALLELPERLAGVTAEDVRRVAASYLLPERRTIVWLGPAPAGPEGPAALPRSTATAPAASRPPLPVDAVPLPPPVTRRLSGGVPVILQPSDLSASAHLRIVLPVAGIIGTDASANDPVLGYSSLAFRLRPAELAGTLVDARRKLDRARATPPAPPSADPATRLEQVFAEIIGGRETMPLEPALIVLSGDLAMENALGPIEQHFGDLSPPPPRRPPEALDFSAAELPVRLGKPLAQARIGYIVPAPGPEDADAFRLLLYILSHDYEGRLGKEAISRRGLAYYIDARYRSDGTRGWITLAVGIDPEKIDPLKNLLRAELRRLADEPPTRAEVAEAKAHFAGRGRSAAQSNEELTAALARRWLWYGPDQSTTGLDSRMAGVAHGDVLDSVAAFVGGTTIVITE